MSGHETYVYGPEGRRYRWRCLTCPAVSPPEGYRRRMDADDAANQHAERTA